MPNSSASLLYGLIVLLSVATIALGWALLDQRRRYRARINEAELRELRTQLNPHFLFNALNAISELGYGDPAAADGAITRLSGLLRKSLDESHGQEISLRAEVDFLDDYLSLQRLLMRDALDVTMTIEPRAFHARVPTMILQPLVENALVHGQNRAEGSRVAIAAVLSEGVLSIEICDNGPGLSEPGDRAKRSGIGLANARARLKHLYGDMAGVTLQNGEAGGAIARIRLPFRELP
jgi:two-component system, LytTR family, sensor kinase